MKRKLTFSVALSLALLASLLFVFSAAATPPAPGDQPFIGPRNDVTLGQGKTLGVKPLDQPNPKDYWRNQERQRLLEAGQIAEANALALTGEDRVLVILVEFAGTDTFTWTAGESMWDPLGMADPNEAVYDANGDVVVGDCSNIINETTTFTYTGPLHNQIPRPLSAADRSGDSIWTEDFSGGWFNAFMFGDGVKFQYAREDGSVVNEDFTGKSVKDYFMDLSGGRYSITGDVIGWLPLAHSTWWYGADRCPGNRSGMSSGSGSDGGIPGAGSNRSMVKDALDAVNAISNTIPGFDWKNYDLDGDGIIDRLWIVHAGYGEEDGTVLLNRTSYSEAANWSHSSAVVPAYPVSPDVAAGPYIMMPENGGIGVFAHESAHNLGADDLYAYTMGETSAGFWALQADDWTGYPIGFEPPAADPWHLDNWGWLDPLVTDDPGKEYVVTVGQASNFPGGEGVVRGVKIPLPDGQSPLPVPVWQGQYYWWGGKGDLMNGMMTTKNPIAIPAGAQQASLAFDLVYDIEDQWDFLWVQASEDGLNWTTLTNANTVCTHDPDWIGELYGFPADMCAAGIGGFTNYNANWPDPEVQTLDLTAFAGKNVLLRWWYMTDWGTTYTGPFVDNVQVSADSAVLFADNAEGGDANWLYAAPWVRSDGSQSFTHNFYLQWRNVSETGGYDAALGDARWRFGPANTGLLVWYNNNFYSDNEIYSYLQDFPSFGPKGRMLVVDAHPEPYRDPDYATDYPNAIANLATRGMMRDAPFSLWKAVDFLHTDPYRAGANEHAYLGRDAVGSFHDAFGYYGGLEFARRGILPCTSMQWYDKQWDASAVVPAQDFYSTKTTGPAGFTSATGIRMRGFINPGSLCGAAWYGFWYTPWSTPANSGNPAEDSAQYGWHVEILSQTEQTATLRIWNSMYEFDGEIAQMPNTASVIKGSVVQVEVMATNVGSPVVNGFGFLPIDTTVEEYVPGSATGGAFPVTASMAAELKAQQGIAAASVPEGVAADTVVGVAWASSVPTGASGHFGFAVQVTADAGEIHHSLAIFNKGSYLVASLESGVLEIKQAAKSTTATFVTNADTTVDQGMPNTNYGGWTYLYVGSDDSTRTLLGFDLSSINPAYPVDQATLSVFVESFAGGGSPAELRVYGATSIWAEGTATWNTPWVTAGGDFTEPAIAGAAIDNSAVGSWITFDVTPLVQQWVADPTANAGAILRLRNATSYTTYRLASHEYWVAADAPKLEVTYREP